MTRAATGSNTDQGTGATSSGDDARPRRGGKSKLDVKIDVQRSVAVGQEQIEKILSHYVAEEHGPDAASELELQIWSEADQRYESLAELARKAQDPSIAGGDARRRHGGIRFATRGVR